MSSCILLLLLLYLVKWEIVHLTIIWILLAWFMLPCKEYTLVPTLILENTACTYLICFPVDNFFKSKEFQNA